MLGVFAIVLNLAVVGMYVGMTKFADKHEKELSPLAPQTVTPRAGILQNTANINIQKFPEPRLQNDDTSDMTRFLAKEAEAQTAQPWQDAQGNVHLPIDLSGNSRGRGTCPLHPREDDQLELEPLRAVDRHQRHARGVLHPVDVALERDPLEVPLESVGSSPAARASGS